MAASVLDRIYAGISNRRLFFKGGWGDLSLIRELQAHGAVDPGPATQIEISWDKAEHRDHVLIRQGSFPSPDAEADLPTESRTAFLEWIMPEGSSPDTPVCIHFAATGDEGFARRRRAFALPLARMGIGSVILENPFYGRRRPVGQQGKMLRYVSELWTMGAATVREGCALSRWFRDEGYRRQASCGISMGGHMAAKVGVLSEVPMAIVCFVTPHSAAAVFTEGALTHYCAWKVLDGALAGNGRAWDLMRAFLDLTDIRRLPPPAEPQSAFLIGARRDAYISAASVELLHGHWKGSTLRWIDTGHLGAFLFHRDDFLSAVKEALEALRP